VHAFVAPAEAILPYIVFAMQDGDDVRVLANKRIMTNLVYLVKVVGEEDITVLAPINDRIDALLDGAQLISNAHGLVLGCTRESPINYPEVIGTVIYRHLGGLYQIAVQDKQS
jgi:hypothetical protein